MIDSRNVSGMILVMNDNDEKLSIKANGKRWDDVLHHQSGWESLHSIMKQVVNSDCLWIQ